MRIRIDNIERAHACVAWLIDNVGPSLPHAGGSHVHGEGWHYWLGDSDVKMSGIHVELTSDVDTDTQLLFALKWS